MSWHISGTILLFQHDGNSVLFGGIISLGTVTPHKTMMDLMSLK